VIILPSPERVGSLGQVQAKLLPDWLARACGGRASAVGVSRCVAARKTAGTACSSLGSLDEACSSVKPDEARERIWPIPT
jgi:hypothetical protein